MTELYDMVIVGGGPAGLAAAIYGARAKMKTVIIEEGELGGQAASTQVIENYPGFFGPEAGQDVVEKMAAHAAHFGAEIISDEVTGVELVGEMKKVTTVEHGVYQGHTVIFCPGSQPRVLGIPGELEFRGRGVSYCATCDGDFFTDLELAVVGNGDAAIEEAMHLTRFASKVTIIVIHDQGIVDCNKVSAEKAFANPKISWVWNSVLTEIQGEELVDGVTIKNIKTGECSALAVSGVFFFVGSVPRTQLVAQQLPLNPQGYIITNEQMETALPGVYAAGDVRQKYLRQVITAAADGATAAVAAGQYISETELFRKQVLAEQKPVLLVFWAPQNAQSIAACGNAEKLSAVLSGSCKLVKMDTYRNQKTAANYGVNELPTVLLLQQGELLGKLSGDISTAQFMGLLQNCGER